MIDARRPREEHDHSQFRVLLVPPLKIRLFERPCSIRSVDAPLKGNICLKYSKADALDSLLA